jgi:hypothetical protein
MVLLVGCTTRLAPAPGAARIVEGPGEAAVAQVDGLRVIARVNAWRGYPNDLDSEVTTVLVTVENDSGYRVRLRHDQFALVSPLGRTFAARAPRDVDGVVREHDPYVFPAPGVLFPYSPLRRHAAYRPRWNDAPSWERYPTRLVDLPTGDMVRKALADTTVEPGGRAGGYLYFEKVREVEAVTLDAVLVDAATAQPFATIRIPFVVE